MKKISLRNFSNRYLPIKCELRKKVPTKKIYLGKTCLKFPAIITKLKIFLCKPEKFILKNEQKTSAWKWFFSSHQPPPPLQEYRHSFCTIFISGFLMSWTSTYPTLPITTTLHKLSGPVTFQNNITFQKFSSLTHSLLMTHTKRNIQVIHNAHASSLSIISSMNSSSIPIS